MRDESSIELDSDTGLMVKAREGDRAAYEKIYRRYFSAVVSFLARRTGSRDVGEDLAQEVFTRVWERRTRYQPLAPVRNYLLGVAANVLRESRAKGHDQVFFDIDDSDTLPDANRPQPPSQAQSAEQLQAVGTMMASLSARQRQAVELVYLAGLAPAEAGAAPIEAGAGLVHLADISTAMGGRLGIHLATPPERADAALDDARRMAARIRAWAGILSRHDPASALTRLNRDPRPAVAVGPTLAAVLCWGREVGRRTGGLVDVAMLAERLAAGGEPEAAVAAGPARRWALAPRDGGRPGAIVARRPGLGLDLDGVGKGWLADRALRLLAGHPGALVDGDGDLAIRVAPGDRWEVSVADPRVAGGYLAVFEIDAARAGAGSTFGLATSGTSVHRWERAGAGAHHLIDPRTGQPARTDVVQATVLAGSAAEAEAWAKCAVLLGGAAGVDLLDRAGVSGAVLLLADGRAVALPRTTDWLA